MSVHSLGVINLFEFDKPIKSEREVWRGFAERTDGKLIEDITGWWIFKQTELKVIAPVAAWKLTLSSGPAYIGKDCYKETWLTIRYKSHDIFEFDIKNRELGWLPGAKLIKLGEPIFDQKFIISGSNTLLIQKLLTYPYIRNQISQCIGKRRHPFVFDYDGNDIGMSAETKLGWGCLESKAVNVRSEEIINELTYTYGGMADDPRFLLDLHQMLTVIMNQLFRIGCAIEDA